ncbi:hypothetical protein VIGAN_11139300, partial [Vigna angularis var. angularis]
QSLLVRQLNSYEEVHLLLLTEPFHEVYFPLSLFYQHENLKDIGRLQEVPSISMISLEAEDLAIRFVQGYTANPV